MGSSVHVDWVMKPDEYQIDDEHAEYLIECPDSDGKFLVEYKMSEVGRQFGPSEEGQFFESKEGVPPGGINLDHKLRSIGDDYVLDIRIKTLDGNLIDSVEIRGDLKNDIKIRRFRSSSGQEIVIVPDLKSMIREQLNRSPVRIPDVNQPHIIEFSMIQAKTKDTEEVRKIVFTTNGVLLPNRFFSRGNKYGGLRSAQSYGNRKYNSYQSALKGGFGRGRSFMTSMATRTASESESYKGKMKGVGQDVKIGMVLTKDQDSKTATLEEVYFKIHPSLFEAGEWYDPKKSPEIRSKVGIGALKSKTDFTVDAYNLEDITSLCWKLEEHILGVGDMLKEEEDPNFAQNYRKKLSMAKRYLKYLKPHQVLLQNGIDDYYQIPSRVNSIIRGVQEMPPIDALFKSRSERVRKKWKKSNRNASIGELMAIAEALILVLDPPSPGDSKWENVKGAVGRMYKKFKGQRGKAKGRLRGTTDLLRSKKSGVPMDQQDDIQNLLNRAAASQV